jgi:uncharacterized protein (DUF4415 family)
MGDFDHLTKAERKSLKARVKAGMDAMTDAEDERITAAALTDPDNPPGLIIKLKRVGRPPASVTKVPVTLRLDREVVARFRATGEGWQTRMNEALRKAVGLR